MAYDVVVPTAGRPSLARTLAALAAGDGPPPRRVIVVDDRPGPSPPLALPRDTGPPVSVVRARGAGPAAARNAGWRAGTAEWVAFLDDDVVPALGWRAALAADLAGLAPDVAGSQGRIEVPAPRGRRPTDWERNVAGLAGAAWATADLAYRRAALEAAGGFDERFGRAYREDSELALRLLAGGWRLVRGQRRVVHPVRPAPASISLALQAGNADDALMRRLHGRGWRARAGAPRGRRRRHLAITAAGLLALAPGLPRRPRGLAAAGWLAGTAELAWARIAPGPRTADEVARMLWTSAAMPAVASWHAARGAVRHRGVAPARPARPPAPAAVLLDRDGTLVRDVPYNGDPARVEPMPGARAALDRLRARGVRLGVVSNQSGVGRGLLAAADVERVNARVEQLLGPFETWQVCPHRPADGCACRKPRPGLVLAAAGALGLAPARCAVVGDIGADVEAAQAAGARAILVPTPRTRTEEVLAAPEVAGDLGEAVDRLLGAGAPAGGGGGGGVTRVLAARLDSDGDVLLTGPALRAVAAGAGHLTLLCGPRGRRAGGLLPGIDELLCWRAPWIDPEPEPVDRDDVLALEAELRARRFDGALIFTSFHQSPLPLALLLRMAGVPRIAAISEDYPGSLLDVRHRVDDGLHEVQRALSLAATLGYELPPGDDGRLAVARPGGSPPAPAGSYVVVHPGASVPARAWEPEHAAELVELLRADGWRVVVTGAPGERALTAQVAGPARDGVVDLGGATTLAELADVLAGAAALVVGNTGPAHLAAAVGTPVVSLFAPTVPAVRWRPWGVAHELLFVDVPCGGCRARTCPVPGHPCLAGVGPAEAAAAVRRLAGAGALEAAA